MNTTAIAQLPQQNCNQQITQKHECSGLSQQITQIAVRILFISVCTLIAAYAAPIAIYNFTVGTVAISSACISGFFFPKSKLFLGSLPSLGMLDLQAQQVELPQGAPRGLQNTGNNCFLNTLVHYIDADPALGQWLRTPIVGLEEFIDFVNDYPQPPDLMDEFRVYIQGRQRVAFQEHQQMRREGAVRMPAIATIFRDFLNQHPINGDREHQERRVFLSFKDSFEAIYHIKVPFSKFLREYDQSIQNDLPVAAVDSQELRRAICKFKTYLPLGPVQMDLDEVLGYIFEALPPRLKIQVEEAQILENPHGEGKGARNTPPEPIISSKIEMTIPDGDGPFLLSDVFHSWHHETTEHEPFRRIGHDGVEREYPVESTTHQFLEAPPALRIVLKRFAKPPTSWLTPLFSWLWPALPYAKNTSSIDSPEILTILTKDGEGHQYQLVSFGTHIGTRKESGHYLGGRIQNGEKYIVNDTQVTPVRSEADLAVWNKHLRAAYLLNYVPVHAQ